jgi:hypothetical protein
VGDFDRLIDFRRQAEIVGRYDQIFQFADPLFSSAGSGVTILASDRTR